MRFSLVVICNFGRTCLKLIHFPMTLPKSCSNVPTTIPLLFWYNQEPKLTPQLISAINTLSPEALLSNIQLTLRPLGELLETCTLQRVPLQSTSTCPSEVHK